MRRASWLVTSFLLAAAGANQAAAERPAITELAVVVDAGAVAVSYRLEDVLSPSLLEKISIGIRVEFRHHVQLLAPAPLWFDRVVAEARVDTAAVYDSLTKRYELVREIATESGPRVETLSTSSADVMRDWMTVLEDFPPLPLPPSRDVTELRVRAESVVGRRWLLLVPTARAVSAERELSP